MFSNHGVMCSCLCKGLASRRMLRRSSHKSVAYFAVDNPRRHVLQVVTKKTARSAFRTANGRTPHVPTAQQQTQKAKCTFVIALSATTDLIPFSRCLGMFGEPGFCTKRGTANYIDNGGGCPLPGRTKDSLTRSKSELLYWSNTGL